jgi:hypothetical protein
MEFPNGLMTIDVLLIAFLVIDFICLMLVIGITTWLQKEHESKEIGDAPRAPASRRHGARRGGGAGRLVHGSA